ncbi:MAG: DUF2007 domain-containing protein [Marinifilaceae bacterium]|jgi:hypothetical protein
MSIKNDLVCIFAGSPMDADIIKQILDDNGIASNLRNGLMSSIAPMYVSGGGVSPAEVEVFTKDEKKARLLVDEFNKSA